MTNLLDKILDRFLETAMFLNFADLTSHPLKFGFAYDTQSFELEDANMQQFQLQKPISKHHFNKIV